MLQRSYFHAECHSVVCTNAECLGAKLRAKGALKCTAAFYKGTENFHKKQCLKTINQKNKFQFFLEKINV